MVFAGIPASPSSHAAVPPHSRAAKPNRALILLFVGKQDRVDQSVGALRGANGIFQRFLAAVVDSIGEHDQRLAALLLLDYFIRGQIDGVVKQRAATALSRSSIRIGPVPVQLRSSEQV